MARYHKYVFDLENHQFVGDFESMYSNEVKENFDSWHSSSLTHLPKKLALDILNQYNFETVLDFGCRKGFFTHLLKKNNNQVTGWDISPTAIKVARRYFGHLCDFQSVDDPVKTIEQCNYDVIIILETLSYIEKWRNLLQVFSQHCNFMYISLYIPSNPIGFVKSLEELEKEVEEYFFIREHIIYNKESVFLLLEKRS